MQLSTFGEVRVFSDVVVFRLENLPALLNPDGNLVGQWTYVESSLLETNDPNRIKEVILTSAENLSYKGKHEVSGMDRKLHKFSAQLPEDQTRELIQSFRYGDSGNQGLHIIARLLRGFDASSVDVLVDDRKSEIRMIQFDFVDSHDDHYGASLTISFSEYGKHVSFDRPEMELTVKPEAFSALFDEGGTEELENLLQ